MTPHAVALTTPSGEGVVCYTLSRQMKRVTLEQAEGIILGVSAAGGDHLSRTCPVGRSSDVILVIVVTAKGR